MNCRFYIVVLSNNWVHFMFDPAPDILIQDCFCSTPMMGNRLFDLTDYIQNNKTLEWTDYSEFVLNWSSWWVAGWFTKFLDTIINPNNVLDKMMLKTDKKSDLSSQKSFEAQQNLVRDKRNLFGKTYQLITLSWLEFKLSKVVNHTFIWSLLRLILV